MTDEQLAAIRLLVEIADWQALREVYPLRPEGKPNPLDPAHIDFVKRRRDAIREGQALLRQHERKS